MRGERESGFSRQQIWKKIKLLLVLIGSISLAMLIGLMKYPLEFILFWTPIICIFLIPPIIVSIFQKSKTQKGFFVDSPYTMIDESPDIESQEALIEDLTRRYQKKIRYSVRIENKEIIGE